MMRFEGVLIGACGLLLGAAGLGGVALAASGEQPPHASSPPAARPASTDVAAVVRAIRERDSWPERIASLRVEAVFSKERTPAFLASMRRNFQEQDPRTEPAGNINLAPRLDGRTELVFDRTRVRTRFRYSSGVDRVAAFDGRRVVEGVTRTAPVGRADFEIARGPGRFFAAEEPFPSLFLVPHRFWWAADSRTAFDLGVPGPEDFVSAGRGRFADTDCDVFCEWGTRQSLYIADGRVRGVKLGLWGFGLNGRCADLLRKAGFDVRDGEHDFRRSDGRLPGLDEGDRRKAGRILAAHMPELAEALFEYGLDDYREVAPGCWFPFRQVKKSPLIVEGGRPELASIETVRVSEVQVDRPLPDELFAVAIPEGATVRDETATPTLTYEQKAKFTPGEWAAILARGREEATRKDQMQRVPNPPPGRPSP